MRTKLLSLLAISLSICLLAAACGGGGAAKPIAPGGGDASITGLASPAELLKNLSSTGGNTLNGADFDDSIPHQSVTVDGTNAIYSPDTGNPPLLPEMAYAAYHFNLEMLEPADALTLEWAAAPAAANLWVAFANWGLGRWDWYNTAAADSVPVEHMASYLTESGDILAVIAVTGTEPATLSSLEIAGTPRDDWNQFGHDAQHTHRSPFVGAQTNALKWTFHTTGPGSDFMCYDPLVGPDGTIYAACGPDLCAFNPDGSLRWRLEAIYPCTSPAQASDGTLYILADGGYTNTTDRNYDYLFAIDSSSGSILWHYNTELYGWSSTPLVGPDGTIYQCGSSRLFAINPDGTQKWVQSGSFSEFQPALDLDGNIYTNNGDMLWAYDSDGQLLWSPSKIMYIRGSPTIGPDGTIYIHGQDPEAYAINPDDGSIKWSCDVENTSWDLPTADKPALTADGLILFGRGYGSLSAVNPDGTIAWTQQITPTPMPLNSPVVNSDGTIAVCAIDGAVYLLNPDGTVKNSFNPAFNPRGMPSDVRPAFGVNGQIYYRTRSNVLYALDQNAELQWSYSPGDEITSSPVLGGDGTIYFACDDGRQYAVNPDGTERWHQGDQQVPRCMLVSRKGVVYGGSRSGCNAYTPDGSLIWSYPHPVDSAPTICFDGAVVVGVATINWSSDSVSVLDPNGNLRWSYNNYCPGTVAPAIASDGTIYSWGSTFDNVTPESISGISALDIDGNLKWKFVCPGGKAPSIGEDGTIYIAVRTALIAVNPDGSEKWRESEHAPFELEPGTAIGNDGSVYVIGFGQLYAFDQTGAYKWNSQVESYLNGPPAIGADGTLYLGSGDGKFYALDDSGALKWSYQTGGGIISSPAIGKDGTVYIGSKDGKLYAFGPGPGA